MKPIMDMNLEWTVVWIVCSIFCDMVIIYISYKERKEMEFDTIFLAIFFLIFLSSPISILIVGLLIPTSISISYSRLQNYFKIKKQGKIYITNDKNHKLWHLY